MVKLSYIGFGSNVGDRVKHVRQACRLISRLPGTKIVKTSPLYETSPVGPKQREFINGVIKVRTSLSSFELLTALKSIETSLGRKPSKRWGPRIIDLDILLYGADKIRTKELIVPHKELARRLFVLRPLADLAPRKRHPITGASVREMLKIASLTYPGQKVRMYRK